MARRAIGTIDFKHLDLMIAQHAGQSRSIGAGPFNSGATQMTERIRPCQQMEIPCRVGRYRSRSEKPACLADHSPDMRIQMRVNPENHFVLFHACIRCSGRIANPNRRTGHSRCRTKLLLGHRRWARQRSGNAGTQSTGQRKGSLANPSTGQIGPTFRSDLRLSISAMGLPRRVLGSSTRLARSRVFSDPMRPAGCTMLRAPIASRCSALPR